MKPRVNRELHYMDPQDRAEYEAERNAARAAIALAKASKKNARVEGAVQPAE